MGTSHTHHASTQDHTSDKSQRGGGGVRTPGPPSGSALELDSSPHIVQIRDFLEFLHEYCKEKSETCTKF